MGLCPSIADGANGTAASAPTARFHVVNVDEYGHDGSKGFIEVYSEGILLRRRHTADVFWPLRSLRRYGCNEELFTFESGRQCETGPGVFAFRLKRPEKLFETVKGVIEQEAKALIESTRRSQQGISITEVNPSLTSSDGTASRFTSSSSQSNPPSLLVLSKMPTTNQMSGTPGPDSAPPTNPYPTHHEFIETQIPISLNTASENKTNHLNRSRPPPLNLQQQSMYINQMPPKHQHPARWDYVDLAEPPPTSSPKSANGTGPKSVTASFSSNTDSSTHYTQVNISRTDAIRNASTAAPSSQSNGGTFVMPSVNVPRATSNSPAANGSFRPNLPIVASKPAKVSDQ